MTKRLISLLLAVVIILGAMSAGTVPVSAKSELVTSDKCLEILEKEEGFSAKPYWDHTQYTVGYGTRCPDDMLDYYLTHGITEAEARILLRNHLSSVELDINTEIIDGYGLKLTQNQFDALVLFSYNCGTGWVYDDNGTLNKALKAGATGNDIIRAFALWCNAGGQILETLLRRRLTEANMFLNGEYSVTPPDNYCYVLYDANGGTVSPRSQGYDSNTPVKPFSTPTYSGYTFVGWYTQRTGGTKVTKLNASVKNTTLYAQWVDVEGNPPATNTSSIDVTVTTDGVNLRQGPGTSYPIVGTANNGDKLTITETTYNGTLHWGKFNGGWICLQYTNYDRVSQIPPALPIITAQPTATVVAVDAKLSFTVAAKGDSLTYQWQCRNTSSGAWRNSTATGCKTATMSGYAVASMNGYQYRCKITDKNGNVIYTSAATLKVVPAITTQPKTITVAAGAKLSFTVAAKGDALTYQWQCRNSASGAWRNSTATGCKTATMSGHSVANMHGYQYRCKVTDKYGNAAYTNAATLKVVPAITTQPKAASVAVGAKATFTISAKGDALTYQWQFRTTSTGSWYNSGANGGKTATMSVSTAASMHGYQYRCKITDKYGNIVYSNAADLTVVPAVTTQPKSTTIAAGEKVNFTIAAKGTGLTYQWQCRNSASGSWRNSTATGCKTVHLSGPTVTSMNGYQYRCKITDQYGNITYTNAATLNVK